MHAFHGVMPEERVTGNDFLTSIRVAYPWQEAALTDDLRHTLNYAELAEIVKREMSIPSSLLEHVAGRIAKAVFESFDKATEVEISITKCHPPMDVTSDGATVSLKATQS